jgi:cytochrome P450/NADPH-cytochrome P450 reductase
MTNDVHPIPRASRKPLVGNIPDLARAENPIEGFTKLVRAHGPIVEIDLPDGRLVLVASHRYAQEIWDDDRFQKSVSGPLELLRELVGDGLFTAYDEEPNWKLAHDLLLPAFGFQSIRGYFPHMLEIAEQLTDKWESAQSSTWLDICDDMTRLTLDTIALCGFGARFESFARPSMHPFVEGMVRALLEVQKKSVLPTAVQKLRVGARRQLESDIRLLNDTVDNIIKERRRSSARVHDLLDRMLHARDPETGAQLSDTNIRFQVITFLIAGHETTSGMLSFALHLLLQHPQILAKARAEVDGVLGPDRSTRPTWKHISKLSYIKQTLRESLRLYPTAPIVARKARERTVIDGRYLVEPEQDLLMLLDLLHRDPAVWGADADTFDPAHFDRAAMAARPPHAFKGFGSGPRACIGSQFAMAEATLVLAMVLHRFELEGEPGYELGTVHTLTVKPRALKARVRPRTPERHSTEVVESPATKSDESPVEVLDAGARLTVLFGSNMGTAESFASRLADAADARGIEVHVAPLDSVAQELPNGPLAIVTSTYNGHPPDNACAFTRRLDGDAPDHAADLVYAVFGCGHSDWVTTFQAIPRRIDARLAAWGAARLIPAGEGDANDDLEGAFDTWSQALFESLTKHFGLSTHTAETHGPQYAVEVGPPQAANPFVASFGALPMRVLANRELQQWPDDSSHRSTRHIEFALPEGISYEAGDHLGVIPRNAWDRVHAVAERFGIEAEATLRIRALGRRGDHLPLERSVSLSELLSVYVELQDPATRTQVETLAAHTRCPNTGAELTRLSSPGADGAYRREVLAKRLSVLDLLERFRACELPFNLYLGMLPPLRPRYYSISSSPLVDERRCSITVGVVEGEAFGGNGIFRGVCSNHLAHVAVGSSAQAFVRGTGSDFRLPLDARTPTIMVGAGTGIAPFIGFLQARTVLAERGLPVGPNALFFGCRHPDHDFLYREGLQALTERKILTLYPAFSRLEGQPRTYVQDRLRAEGGAVWDLLQQGAVVYVCGDAGAMEPAVRAALQAIHGEKTGASASTSAEWLDHLRAEGRYFTDVWASS